MLENRRHLRIRERLDITWNVPGEDIAGQGQVLNISSSGMLLQIDNSFKTLSQCVISVDPEFSEEEASPFINKKGKVVWFRKTQNPHYNYQCGVEFMNSLGTDDGLLSWIEKKTSGLSQAMSANILNNYIA